VAKSVFGRNQIQCLHRWTKILQPGLTKGPWTIEEDRRLLQWVKKEGPNKWTTCAEFIKGRSGKQCRERWLNTLNPNVKKGNWEPEEDFMIFKLFNEFGSQWSKINRHFNRRTENSIKNRFYSTLRRIAAEKKKENSEKETFSLGSKLDGLIRYIPDALEEKSQILMKKNNHKELVLNDNLLESYEKNKECNQHFDLINKLPLDELENKIENLCKNSIQNNNNKEINNTNFNSNYDNNYGMSDENIGFLDNQISNFIDSFFESSSNEKNCTLNFLHNNDEKIDNDVINSNLNVNIDNINESNLNSFVLQLTTLEEILLNTKKQILAASDFGEKIKIPTKNF